MASKCIELFRHCDCDPTYKMPTVDGLDRSDKLGEKYRDRRGQIALVASGSEIRCQVAAGCFCREAGLNLKVAVEQFMLDPANEGEKASFRALPGADKGTKTALSADSTLFLDIPLQSREGVKFLETVGGRVLLAVHRLATQIKPGQIAIGFSHMPVIEFALLAWLLRQGRRRNYLLGKLHTLCELESVVFWVDGQGDQVVKVQHQLENHLRRQR